MPSPIIEHQSATTILYYFFVNIAYTRKYIIKTMPQIKGSSREATKTATHSLFLFQMTKKYSAHAIKVQKQILRSAKLAVFVSFPIDAIRQVTSATRKKQILPCLLFAKKIVFFVIEYKKYDTP